MGLLVCYTTSSPVRYLLIPPVRCIASSVQFIMRYPMCFVLTFIVGFSRAISVFPDIFLLRSLCVPLAFPHTLNSQTNPGPTFNLGWTGLTPNSPHNLARVPPEFTVSSSKKDLRVPRGLLYAFSRTFPVRSQCISLAFPCAAYPFCQAFRRVFRCALSCVPSLPVNLSLVMVLILPSVSKSLSF